jgi:hypothetical protein
MLAQADPSIRAITPERVVAGSAFTILIEVPDGSPSHTVYVRVYRTVPPGVEQHVSKPLVDNGPDDLDPQVGVIKYVIRTDARWLSRLPGNGLAAARDTFQVFLAQDQQPSNEPLRLAGEVTLIGTLSTADAASVAEGGISALTSAIASYTAILSSQLDDAAHATASVRGDQYYLLGRKLVEEDRLNSGNAYQLFQSEKAMLTTQLAETARAASAVADKDRAAKYLVEIDALKAQLAATEKTLQSAETPP